MTLESLPWGTGDFAMDGFGSFWGHSNNDHYSQSTEELKQKLLQTTIELETLRTTTKEETRKKEESLNKLIQLVKLTTKERDETKEQLNALLSFLQSKKQQQAVVVNSGLTESDSLSDTQTRISNRSHVSSPVESFYHAESSNITTDASFSTGTGNAAATKFDYGSVIIDELAKKRPLPDKGKLMHAVMNAGPLLQTLMVAGPLPRWQNPPMQILVDGSHGSHLCTKRQIALPFDERYTDCSSKRLRTF